MDWSDVAWTPVVNTDWELLIVDWTLAIVVVASSVECVHWSVWSAGPTRTGRTDYVVSVADTQPGVVRTAAVVAVVVVAVVAAAAYTQPAVYSVASVVAVASDRVVAMDCSDSSWPSHHSQVPPSCPS